jgi:ribosomal peptide maturation radical SAM protein 1
MKIVLLHMPWGPIEVPSLALGILKNLAEQRGHQVEVRHANLDFVDWIVAQTDFTLSDYQFFAESSYFQGAGDWVFSSALYDIDEERADRFTRLLALNGATDEQISMSDLLYRQLPDFIAGLADDVVALDPDFVGFTSTFQQNTASLALARLIKQRLPGVLTAFGGANCDGDQGLALHRNFEFLDYLIRGEGEVAFPMLLQALDSAEDTAAFAAIPGLCWRDGDGRSQSNAMARKPLAPTEIAAPDFGGFFDRYTESIAGSWAEPRLVVEGARGCWWGEKHHCTFCGLNGSFMEFRSKSPERFFREIVDMAQRYQLLDFFVVDNILDMVYLESVMPRLTEAGYDVRLHHEVKSNLRRHQFQRLGEAGAVSLQPGIESLSNRVLHLMDKGVTGCQNVRALRDADSAGVTAVWNYLYGFPGETLEDYTSVISQLPALHHLVPPIGAGRIAIERFSPYFDRPELGFQQLRAAPQYAATYRLPDRELDDLAYIFTSLPQGIDEDQAQLLAVAVQAWQDGYPNSRFVFHDLVERILLISRRPSYDWGTLELHGSFEPALFRLLDQPRSVSALASKTGGTEQDVQSTLDRWLELGIVFVDDGRYIQVATEAHNQALLRVDNRQLPGGPSDTRRTGYEREEAGYVAAAG